MLELMQYDEEKIELIKRTIAKGASNDELALFIEQCKRTGLDPFARQIYAVRRRQWDPATRTATEVQVIQVSIDGYRLIADRTQKYAGQTGPWWCGLDGEWVEVWLEDGPPAAAKVGVLRHDFTFPLYGIALFKAYVQRNSKDEPVSRWKTDPAGMLAKCAESLALRRAFPNELSGLYTSEEMSNVGEVVPQLEPGTPALLDAPQAAALPEPEHAEPEFEEKAYTEAPQDENQSEAVIRAFALVTPSEKKTRLGDLNRDDLAKLKVSILTKQQEGKLKPAWLPILTGVETLIAYYDEK